MESRSFFNEERNVLVVCFLGLGLKSEAIPRMGEIQVYAILMYVRIYEHNADDNILDCKYASISIATTNSSEHTDLILLHGLP